MKVYGAQICIDCRIYREIQKKRGFAAEFIEITEDTGKLKEFLARRDREPVFQTVREQGGIGIPYFVNEDGRTTLDIDEAFSWLGQEPVRPEEKRLLCKLLKVEEDVDFGCEERSEDEPAMAIVTVQEENGFVRTLRVPDQYLYDCDINEGDEVFLEKDGAFQKKED